MNNSNKLVGWHRWMNGGTGDDVVVLVNFSATSWSNYRIGMPRGGMWKCRFNSDWNGYSSDFANTASPSRTSVSSAHAGGTAVASK